MEHYLNIREDETQMGHGGRYRVASQQSCRPRATHCRAQQDQAMMLVNDLADDEGLLTERMLPAASAMHRCACRCPAHSDASSLKALLTASPKNHDVE